MGSDSSSATDRRPTPYRERLHVPWWWWLAGAIVTAVIGYEISLSARGSSWALLAYVIVGVLVLSLLWSMSRTPVEVTSDGELIAGKARLPRDVIARAASIPATAKSAALGRQLDPAAFLVHRSWVKTMVILVLDDPDDPTPYWLVSTRHPGKVLAALGLDDATLSPGPDSATTDPETPDPETTDSQTPDTSAPDSGDTGASNA